MNFNSRGINNGVAVAIAIIISSVITAVFVSGSIQSPDVDVFSGPGLSDASVKQSLNRIDRDLLEKNAVTLNGEDFDSVSDINVGDGNFNVAYIKTLFADETFTYVDQNVANDVNVGNDLEVVGNAFLNNVSSTGDANLSRVYSDNYYGTFLGNIDTGDDSNFANIEVSGASFLNSRVIIDAEPDGPNPYEAALYVNATSTVPYDHLFAIAADGTNMFSLTKEGLFQMRGTFLQPDTTNQDDLWVYANDAIEFYPADDPNGAPDPPTMKIALNDIEINGILEPSTGFGGSASLGKSTNEFGSLYAQQIYSSNHVRIGDDLSVLGDMNVHGDLNVFGTMYGASPIRVGDDMNLLEGITVDGNMFIRGDVFDVEPDANFYNLEADYAFIDNLQISGATIGVDSNFTNIGISGNTFLEDTFVQNLYGREDINFAGDHYFYWDDSLGNLVIGDAASHTTGCVTGNCFVLGANSSATANDGFAYAIGSNCHAQNEDDICIGHGGTVNATYGKFFGLDGTVTGIGATNVGVNNNIAGLFSSGFGYDADTDTSCSYCTSLGYDITNYVPYSTLIGLDTNMFRDANIGRNLGVDGGAWFQEDINVAGNDSNIHTAKINNLFTDQLNISGVTIGADSNFDNIGVSQNIYVDGDIIGYDQLALDTAPNANYKATINADNIDGIFIDQDVTTGTSVAGNLYDVDYAAGTLVDQSCTVLGLENNIASSTIIQQDEEDADYKTTATAMKNVLNLTGDLSGTDPEYGPSIQARGMLNDVDISNDANNGSSSITAYGSDNTLNIVTDFDPQAGTGTSMSINAYGTRSAISFVGSQDTSGTLGYNAYGNHMTLSGAAVNACTGTKRGYGDYISISGGTTQWDYLYGLYISAASPIPTPDNWYSIYSNTTAQSYFKGAIRIRNDNEELTIGIGDDLQLSHDGTDSLIKNSTGDLNIEAPSGQVVFDADTNFLNDANFASLEANDIYAGNINISGATIGVDSNFTNIALDGNAFIRTLKDNQMMVAGESGLIEEAEGLTYDSYTLKILGSSSPAGNTVQASGLTVLEDDGSIGGYFYLYDNNDMRIYSLSRDANIEFTVNDGGTYRTAKFRGKTSSFEGFDAEAKGNYGFAWGNGATAGTPGGNIALGPGADATNYGDIAIGGSCTASGGSSICLGLSGTASGYGASVLGGISNQATSSYAVATGYFNQATNLGAFATGHGTKATGSGAFSNGYSSSPGSSTLKVWATGSASFVTGSAYATSGGNSWLLSSGTSSMAVGYATGGTTHSDGIIESSGTGSMATGYTAGSNTHSGNFAYIQSPGAGSFARGYAQAGYTDTNQGSQIISTGQGAMAGGYGFNGNIYAVGKGSLAQGFSDNNHTIQAGSTADHNGAVAIGMGPLKADGAAAVVIGKDSQSLADVAITLGEDLNNYQPNSVMVNDLNVQGTPYFDGNFSIRRETDNQIFVCGIDAAGALTCN